LRVIVRPDPIAFLPRNANPVTLDREIAQGLATVLGKRLELVFVDDSAAMVERLMAGDADLIAANLTATPERRRRVAFSIPYLYVDELLIMRSDASPPNSLEDLVRFDVRVRASAFAEALGRVLEEVPDLAVRFVSDDWNLEEVLDLVAARKADATIVDSQLWSAISTYFPSLRAVRKLDQDRPIGIALRPDDTELRKVVNEYLIGRALTGPREEVFTDDLPGLRERRRLRMITRNSAATYFLHRGDQLGFEYELLKRFADSQDLRLEIVIPPSRSDLDQWLADGHGDVISASLSPTDDATERTWTDRYAEVAAVVAVRADDPLAAPADLEGRTVHVRNEDAYLDALDQVVDGVPGVVIAPVPADMETEEMLARVADGTWDVVLCGSNALALETNAGANLKAAFSAGVVDLAWTVRADNPTLLGALNDFIRREYRGLHYNLLRARYFESRSSLAFVEDDEWRSDRSGRISPFDDLVKAEAKRFQLDWRLLVAQMYQESRFQSDRVSFAGATGLMQLLPRTASDLEVDDLFDPAHSIRGGAEYMRQLMDSFSMLPPDVQRQFSLAAYNAGRGHVLDAQRLARRIGLSGELWYGHVERAMLLLQRAEYYEQARYGYCRGSECVHYVNDIDRRYRAYSELVPEKSPKGT
jgi:membrane-bound lytic murein transglycosylase F